jgi:hypothetical protein
VTTMHAVDVSKTLNTFANLVSKLEHIGPEASARKTILTDVMNLVNADYIVSYCWDPNLKKFSDPFAVNVSDDHVANYQNEFQFRDPISKKLKALRHATPIQNVFEEGEFRNTLFYNDFLRSEGMFHGINLYIEDDGRDLGDLRIWRAKARNFVLSCPAIVLIQPNASSICLRMRRLIP